MEAGGRCWRRWAAARRRPRARRRRRRLAIAGRAGFSAAIPARARRRRVSPGGGFGRPAASRRPASAATPTSSSSTASSGSSRRRRTRAARSSIPTNRRSARYSTPAFALAGATLCAARPDPALLAGGREGDAGVVRRPRRRQGRRRPRRLLHRPADARRSDPRAAGRRGGVGRLAPRPRAHRAREDLPPPAHRQDDQQLEPRRRRGGVDAHAGRAWARAARGSRPRCSGRCRCSRIAACTAIRTTRWRTTTSRGCGRST